MQKRLLPILTLIAALTIGVNQYLLTTINHALGVKSNLAPLLRFMNAGNARGATLADIVWNKGMPFYGQELGVTYDDVVGGLPKLAALDPTYGSQKIILTDDEKKRYVKIGMTDKMTCEFCCGAKTLVFANGEAACGCQHSQAMRGILAYMIQKYPDKSDDEMMREVARWKALYFPNQMMTRAQEQLASGTYTPDFAALVLGLDEKTLKQLGAQGNVTAPSSIPQPAMVGGC